MPRTKGASSKTATIEDKPENKKLLDSRTITSIRKEFGDGVIINGTSLVENPKEVVSVSPALDAALGGGFQVGSLVTLAGHPRCGKTTTALHFAAKWQALGRRVVFLNAEQRLEGRDIQGIPGLDPDEVTVVTSIRSRILTAQDFLSIALSFLTQETDLLVIIDSVSILSEEREIIGGIGTETRGGSAKLLAQFCRLATPVIPVNSHVVLAIAHLHANTSGMGKKYMISMGRKVDYALYTSLYSEGSENWMVGSDEDKRIIGQVNHWKVERTPIGPPNEKAISYQRYGQGLDELQEYLQFAEDLSLVNKSGSWISYEYDGQSLKAQGAEKFRQALLDNPEVLASLKSRINEMIRNE